jgi:hypothetical protein
MIRKDYKFRFILNNKTNVKDILEIKYPYEGINSD